MLEREKLCRAKEARKPRVCSTVFVSERRVVMDSPMEVNPTDLCYLSNSLHNDTWIITHLEEHAIRMVVVHSL